MLCVAVAVADLSSFRHFGPIFMFDFEDDSVGEAPPFHPDDYDLELAKAISISLQKKPGCQIWDPECVQQFVASRINEIIEKYKTGSNDIN